MPRGCSWAETRDAVCAARAAFEAKWITWNNVRTAANTASFAALIGALVAR